MSLIPRLTDAGKGLLIQALSGNPLTFSRIKIGSGTAPDTPQSGDYWYDTDNLVLRRYSERWEPCSRTFSAAAYPHAEPMVDDLWYNTVNSTLYIYGDGWNISEKPFYCATSAPENPAQGDAWYDTANEMLYEYGRKWYAAEDVTISAATDAPESPEESDYWYDTANTQLKIAVYMWRDKAGVNLMAAEAAPESPAEGDYWYDTVNTALMKYDGANWAADTQTITCADTAPETAATGDWWYDSENALLMEWGLGWADDATHNFTYGNAPDDPAEGDWWYDDSLHVYESGWIADTEQPFFYDDSAPTDPGYGDWWYDSANGALHEYGMLWKVDAADIFDYSDTAPARPQDGDLWYNVTAGALQEYRTGWITDETINFTYSSTEPTEPSTGDWWYDTGTSALYEYNGARWNLNLTAIFCGASAPATQDVLTDLVNPMVSIAITSMTQETNYVSITGAFDNSEITTGFRWTETGIFANDADGNELLYAYCYAGDDYETIPPNDCGKTIGINLTLLVMVGDAENVTAIVGEGALYASKEELAEHLRNDQNPHGVTKELLGLDKVENTSHSDAVIRYTEPEQFENLAAGDTTATVFGKIKTAFSTLIAHLKAINPHGITPKTIGAAEATHTHSGMQPVFGVFTGNGQGQRKIDLGFTPVAVFMCNGRGMVGDDIDGLCGGLCVRGHGLRTRDCGVEGHETSWSDSHTGMLITNGGFYVGQSGRVNTNKSRETYRYIAFR